jgi:hypothetical protein
LSEENKILTQPFTEEEVFEAISQREYNKAPGSNGFHAEFYHKFWEVIKPDMMEIFVHLKIVQLPLYKLNFGMVGTNRATMVARIVVRSHSIGFCTWKKHPRGGSCSHP